MKKLFLAAVAVFSLSAAASAQTADNCSNVAKVMADMKKDGLKSYRGKAIVEDNLYTSKVNFSGFASSEIMANDFTTQFSSKMAAADKATATKNYNNLLAQMKTCLESKGYNAVDNSMDGNTETTFMDSDGDNIMASVAMKKEDGKYVVSLNVAKAMMP